MNLSIIEDFERGAKQLSYVALTEAVINGKIRIAFDTSDGYFDVIQLDDYLDNVDYCFKRSFSQEKNKKLLPKNGDKVFPLSFNYDVSYFLNPMDFSHSIRDIRVIVHKVLKPYFVRSYENNYTKYNNKVIFMCRLWDPNGAEVCQDKPAQEERKRINQMRMDVIRELRDKLGADFVGGVFDDDFARKTCPELILNKKLTSKKHYLSIMKKSLICIATSGLHNSTGWKFAEYVAAGKAIISEPLQYSVNGNFEKGKNYLEFNTTEECIKKVDYLLRNSQLRQSIEKANCDYYQNFCRPDKQIENALKFVFEQSNFRGDTY